MLQPGAELGRYRIDAPIGAGGMGEVYRARDMTLRRDVAIKVMTPDRLEGESSREFAARMLNEARSAAALSHPNVVSVYDVGETSGMPYIVLELVHGSALRRYLQDATVSLPTKVRWLRDLAAGLAAAHNAGFVHRDVKPANVMITTQGQVKLLDFGIAKRSVTAGNTVGHATLEGPASFQTEDGGLVGTPRYMAPEHAAGMPVDARADQYAWGCVAYELLSMLMPMRMATGRMPLANVVPGLPPPVAAIVERALSPDRAGRFATMNDIVTQLDPFAAGTLSLPPGAYGAAGPGEIAPTMAGTSTQGATATTVPPLGHGHATMPTAPPHAYSSGHLMASSSPSYVPQQPGERFQPMPGPARKSHLGLFIFGAGAALVIVVTAGLFFVFRMLDARAQGPLSSAPDGAASASPGIQSPPVTPVASGTSAAAKSGAKASSLDAGTTAAKAGAAASATTTTSSPATGSCQCIAVTGPDGQPLCKKLGEAPTCQCTGDADLCPVPWIKSNFGATCPAKFDASSRTGGACTGFPHGSTSDDQKRFPGKLTCTLCPSEGRAFSGASQESCRGFHRNTGAAFDGKLLCR